MRSAKLTARVVSALVLGGAVAVVGTVSAPSKPAPLAAAAAHAPTLQAPATLTPNPNIPEHNATPHGGRANKPGDSGEAVTIWDLPAGSVVLNPVSGRHEIIDPTVAISAVLIGDSQAAGAAGVDGAHTWVQSALAARGYKVQFKGAGGTGYVAATPSASNYADAVGSGRVLLPYGNAALVVVQGGGNDAARGTTDEQILTNAQRLLTELKASYPHSEFLLIGTLTREGNESDRRAQVNALMAGFAHRNGLPFISPAGWISRYGVGNNMADGVHLNLSGHRELSRVLSGKLAELDIGRPG